VGGGGGATGSKDGKNATKKRKDMNPRDESLFGRKRKITTVLIPTKKKKEQNSA